VVSRSAKITSAVVVAIVVSIVFSIIYGDRACNGSTRQGSLGGNDAMRPVRLMGTEIDAMTTDQHDE